MISHKKGLLVAGNGIIYDLEKSVKSSDMMVKATYDLGVTCEITALTVDPSYTIFAVGTKQVST